MYSHLDLKLYMLPIIDDSILSSTFDITPSIYPAHPQFSLGYHHFIWQSYELFKKAIDSQKQKTFFNVINGFEMILTEQEKQDELYNIINTYIGIQKEQIETSVFLQMWEMCFVLNLFGTNNNVTININSGLENDIKLAIDSFVKKMMKKTSVSYVTKSQTCDLSIVSIDKYKTLLDQESYCFVEMLKLVNTCLNKLNNGGKFILRLNDTFTIPTCKLIMLLNVLFNNSYIYKPYYSKPYESEKYLVCIGFSKKKYDTISKKLDKATNLTNKLSSQFVVDFMADIDLVNSFATIMANINIILAGIQHKEKNKIMTYINSNDYFGDTYQESSQRQQECVEFFASNFFPINQIDYIEIQKKFIDIIEKNTILIKNLSKIIN